MCMYSTMYLHFMSFLFDSGVGGGVLLSWPEFFLFVDVRLISLRHNTVLEHLLNLWKEGSIGQ